MLSIQVQDSPLHLVMWKGKDSTTTEITELKKRIEELEGLVQKLVVNSQPVNKLQSNAVENKEKITKSPYFKSTSVPEPVGLEVVTHLTLDDKASQSTLNETEVFDKLTQGISEGKATHEEKTVDLNGMTFVIRKWGDDLVYCEGNTGRAFLDPKDAFDNPNKHYIGYWNTDAETVSVRSEEIEDESVNVGQLHESEQKEQKGVSSAEEQKEKQEEEKVEEEQEEEESEEEQEEEVEEEQEEEESLTEFEYKGVTYYRDSENQVYLPTDTENAYGVWNEEKQKVLKYKQ